MIARKNLHGFFGTTDLYEGIMVDNEPRFGDKGGAYSILQMENVGGFHTNIFLPKHQFQIITFRN